MPSSRWFSSVSSWRDSASIEAQNDLDGLLDAVLGFAEQQITRHGEFYPYGASVGNDGSIVLAAAQLDLNDDHPLSADLVDMLISSFAERRDTIRASAIVTDVRMSEGGDAICADLEHAEGHALTALLPYSKRRFPRKVTFGELRAQMGPRRVWV